MIGLVSFAVLALSACRTETDKPVKIPEQKVSIGNYSINYKESGNGKHTIVLEAGLGMDSETWTGIQLKLSENYRVISYDRSGYGKSDHSEFPRTIGNITKDLKLLLETVDAPSPYILVGHSLGGYVIRHFAALYPEHVSGMVMVDSYHEDLFTMLRDSVSESVWIRYLGTGHADKDTLNGMESERVEFMETVVSDDRFEIPAKIPVHVLTSLEPLEDTSMFADIIMDLHESLSLSFMIDHDNVNQTFTKSSGHFIYLNEPELVISSIDNVIQRIENRNNLVK